MKQKLTKTISSVDHQAGTTISASTVGYYSTSSSITSNNIVSPLTTWREPINPVEEVIERSMEYMKNDKDITPMIEKLLEKTLEKIIEEEDGLKLIKEIFKESKREEIEDLKSKIWDLERTVERLERKLAFFSGVAETYPPTVTWQTPLKIEDPITTTTGPATSY